MTLHPSQEQEFLEWFSGSFHGKALQSRFEFGSLYSHCTSFSESFQGHEIAGHGHDADSSLAALKGAAELMERRAVIEYFRQNSHAPLKNTNGWAVHLSRDAAVECAVREALERHILLITFLRSEWKDFILLDRRETESGYALFLASPHIQNGHFGGLVIYRDNHLPGVSFGHLADKEEHLRHSPRWNHALFEAIAFVKRGLETGGFSRESTSAVHQASCMWLLDTWNEPEWKTEFSASPLADVEIEFETGFVSELIPSYSELYFAHVRPGRLLPLYLPSDLAVPEKKAWLTKIFHSHGLRLQEGRVPIL